MVSKTAVIVFAAAALTVSASGAFAQQRLGDIAATYINKYVKTKNGKIGSFDVNSLTSQPQSQSSSGAAAPIKRKRISSLGPR